MQQVGTVKSWFDAKGFGFIVQAGLREDIFVHHTQIRMQGRRSLATGQAVRFRMERRDTGLCAVDVEPIRQEELTGKCQTCGQELPQ